MSNWLNTYRQERKLLISRIREFGQKETARKSGLSEMQVSRFVRGKGTKDAASFFRIAHAFGLTNLLVPIGKKVQVDGELFPIPGGTTK